MKDIEMRLERAIRTFLVSKQLWLKTLSLRNVHANYFYLNLFVFTFPKLYVCAQKELLGNTEIP